jgi:hypothetical protein
MREASGRVNYHPSAGSVERGSAATLLTRPLTPTRSHSGAHGRACAEWQGFSGSGPQILEALGVSSAAPQSHPFAPDHRPTDPLQGLRAIGRSVDPVAGSAAHHPPADTGLGPDGVGVVVHGDRVGRGSDGEHTFGSPVRGDTNSLSGQCHLPRRIQQGRFRTMPSW